MENDRTTSGKPVEYLPAPKTKKIKKKHEQTVKKTEEKMLDMPANKFPSVAYGIQWLCLFPVDFLKQANPDWQPAASQVYEEDASQGRK